MTTLVLPPGGREKSVRTRSSYCAVLTHVARAAFDAEEALELFASLLEQRRPSGFSRFDGHIGDTACHLRATMLAEVYRYCKDKGSAEFIELVDRLLETAAHFRLMALAAQETCFQFTKERLDPRAIGLSPKRETTENIIKALSALALQVHPSGYLHQQHLAARFSDILAASSSLLGGNPMSTSSIREPKILVRFIVYLLVLSKYKEFVTRDEGVGCRLRPDLACQRGRCLMEQFWCHENQDYKEANAKQVLAEFTDMQIWVSQLGCSWLQSPPSPISAGSFYAEFVSASIQVSFKGIAASACFPTYLLLRDVWAGTNSTIIVVNRHFCTQGFHYHLRTFSLRVVPGRNSSVLPWTVQWEDLSENDDMNSLERDQQDTDPCIIAIGNSINGDNNDYVSRLIASDPRLLTKSQLHRDDNCGDHLRQVAKLRSTDFDQLLLASFAAHRSYCIARRESTTEDQIVDSTLSKLNPTCDGPGFKQLWETHRQQIDRLGAGSQDLSTFGLQHFLTETRYGLIELLEKWSLNDDTLPFSA